MTLIALESGRINDRNLPASLQLLWGTLDIPVDNHSHRIKSEDRLKLSSVVRVY